jgi:Lon protease-like protein
MAELPLFPLRTVLYPEGLLELRIFEARYLDLISRSLRERTPFGVVALRAGSEAKSAPGDDAVRLYDAGTLAELIDVDSAEAGILLVRCRGGERFKIGETRRERDGLWVAEVEPIAPDPHEEPAPAHADAVKALADAIAALAAQGAKPFLDPHRLDSAGWVANRWCEILPLPLEVRQRLLTLASPTARLDVVASLLRVRDERPA